MRIMGLSLLNPEFPSPAGRFLLFTTKVMNRTFPSKIYLIFFLDTANLEINPCLKKLSGETNSDCICAYTGLDSLQQEIIRDNHCARQAQTNPARHNKNP